MGVTGEILAESSFLLPADQLSAPGEAAAERGQENAVPVFEHTRTVHLVETDADRRGGGVSIAVDIGINPFLGNRETRCHSGNDPAVCLMRNHPCDLFRSNAGIRKDLFAGGRSFPILKWRRERCV